MIGPLEHYLGARNAMTASEDQIKTVAEEHGLTVMEFIVIAMVKHGVDRSSAIASESGCNQTTVSHNISDLETRGLLERNRVGGDARGFKLALTQQGKAVADSISAAFAKGIEESL